MIRKAGREDLSTVSAMALKLWPENDREELEAELAPLLVSEEAAVFLAFEQEQPVGFAQCQLRHDYVEGTDSSPVGYLEGIYVAAEYRHRGIAARLLGCCEAWAKNLGCQEFASDCELTNKESLAFHLRLHFQEANRIICFTKRL